jgi:queuosine precursor transporter
LNFRFTALSMLFVACLLTANIIAVKLLALPFGLIVPAGILVFPLSYAFNDVIAEVYGYAAMRQVIWLGFVCNLVMVVAIWLGGILPSTSFWQGQGAYEAILGFTPRLLLASFSAYLVGEMVNARVLVALKALMKGRYLWTRCIGSTAVGEALDTVIFVTLAFWGIIPTPLLFSAILTQWLLKIGYEILATPLTYMVVAGLKRFERIQEAA